jgi:hypothetical protein
MKKFFLFTITLLLSVTALGQAPSGNNTALPAGTTAKLALQTALSSKLSEVGDQVIATLYEPVRDGEGRVLIPRGTEFSGRVTQVQAAKRPQRQATMTLTFDTMQMAYGVEKIATVITAIDDYANDEKLKAKDDEGKVGAGRSGGRTATNAGIGAGIGGAGGAVIRATGGGIGGVLGSTAAGAIGGVLLTKGNDIRLQPGTILRLRFEREMMIPVFETERSTTR